MDLGFVQAGFAPVAAVDIDQRALEVHARNLQGKTVEADLSLPSLPDIPFRGIDVLLAGSPCQGFSTIGKRAINDPRNKLILVAGHVASKFKPKIVVVENVPGVKAGQHQRYWNELHEILQAAGYRCTDIKCVGTDFGLAQKRTRWFMVASRIRKDSCIELSTKTGLTLRQALRGVSSVQDHAVTFLDKGSIDFKISSKIGQGQKLSNVRAGPRSVHTWNIPEVFGRTTAEERSVLNKMVLLRRQNRLRDFGDADPVKTSILKREFGSTIIETLVEKGFLRKIDDCHDLTSTFNGKYRRLRWDEPSCTVDTRFGSPRFFLHPSKHRGFSVREAARIQGFPDDFKFSGSLSDQFRLIGNAVPPPMAEHLAKNLKETLLA